MISSNFDLPAEGRSLVAVMFADMVGYSRRMEEDEQRNADQAARSIALFRSLIGNYGGRVANVAGDGILALFASADQALRFATLMKTEFREQAVWGDGQPIEFRIGLNLGEVTIDAGNVQGHCVNVASRLQDMAEPGAIYLTAAFRTAVKDPSGLSLRPVGSRVAKNLSEPIEVFAVDGFGSLAVAPAAAVARPAPRPVAHRTPSIAVLPLINQSDEAANSQLCSAIAQDIIVNLSRFRNLLVIARHSAFQFSLASSSAADIGQRLGVRYLLGGTLRRLGRRLRLAVELTDVASQAVVWSDRADVAIEDLFRLQDDITAAVASRLAVQIDIAERKQESPHPRDLRAYGLVLRGHHLALLHTRESNTHARRLFEEAAAIAPDYGRAYSAMSRSHNLDWRYSWSADPARSLDLAVQLAQRAIQLDRSDARAYAELGFAHIYRKQHDEALADYERALALNPNDADIITEYGDALVYAGFPEKALPLFEKAMQLNPYYPDWYLWCVADAYSALRRPADVVATVLRMQNPDEGRRLLAANYAHLGKIDEARAQARELLRVHPEFTIGKWRDRPAYRDPAILERFIDGLRKAGLPD